MPRLITEAINIAELYFTLLPELLYQIYLRYTNYTDVLGLPSSNIFYI